MNWYLKVLKQYADFSGRARRKEYWMFTLFNILAIIVAVILDSIIGSYGILAGVYVLGSLLPTLAVTVRRLQDGNRSGLWLLIVLVPIVGGFIHLFFMIQDGTKGDNQFGPDPKAGVA